MIVRPKPNLLQLFLIVRGSIIVRIFPQVLAVFLLSTLVVWAHKDRPDLVQALNGAPFSLLGIALSVFLGFRANACYDRWWEARKQWGALITVARTLSRQTAMLESRQDVADPVTRRRITDLVIAFCHALVSHLRPGDATATAANLIPDDLSEIYARSRNKPDMLLREISGAVVSAHGKGQISDIQLQMLDATVQQMGPRRLRASASARRRFPSVIRCCFTAPRISSACCCHSVSRICSAGPRLYQHADRLYVFRSRRVVRRAWKTHSAPASMPCRSMRLPPPSRSICARRWARPICRPTRARWIMC